MKKKISMILFVLILGSILTFVLIGVNYYTKPIIEKNEAIKIKSRVMDAFGISYNIDDIEKVFSENVKIETENNVKYYFTENNEISFEITGNGLWGPITGILALKPDLETIKGITLIHQEETPGLGGRIAEKEYLSSFKDKKIIPKLEIVSPGKAIKENEVDGITGATMTSKAFEELINNQAQKYISNLKRN
ncbi:MAG: FMN-binding protein [Armatimonadetes bacterium]|nr:FMN-binding protein [Armatimonadota bacterium]